MADRLAQRAQTSRLLSSDWASGGYEAVMSRFADWAEVGAGMVDAAGADKRLVAVRNAESIQSYSFMSTSSPEWREVMFHTMSLSYLVMDLVTMPHWANSGLNILSYGTDTHLWDDNLVNGTNNMYFLNDIDLHVSETYWQSQDSPFDDPSSLKYHVVDYSEVSDGSLDGFFDMVIIPLHRLEDYNNKFILSAIDALKPGGMMLIRNVAPRGTAYYSPREIHGFFEHDYSRLIADHAEMTSRHVSWSNGFVVAYKNAE